MSRPFRVVLCALAFAALAVACSDGTTPPDSRIANAFDAPGSGSSADAGPGGFDAAPAVDGVPVDAP